ncbi:hypothetical protein cypCar_00030822 [Cyprinus carpio]|nr:hypothetical protein cypCar_00030822 [Cyprinus carpio]
MRHTTFTYQQISAAHSKDLLLCGSHEHEISLLCRYMGRLQSFIWGGDGQSSRTSLLPVCGPVF